MPRSVVITTTTLVLIAGLAGYWLGKQPVTLNASSVIEAVAERHRGNASDCAGWPVEGASVLMVRCDATTYAVDRFGRVTLVEDEGT